MVVVEVRCEHPFFVAVAEMAETAHEAAIAGQSEALTASAYAEKARRLEVAARSLAALAEAAAVAPTSH